MTRQARKSLMMFSAVVALAAAGMSAAYVSRDHSSANEAQAGSRAPLAKGEPVISANLDAVMAGVPKSPVQAAERKSNAPWAWSEDDEPKGPIVIDLIGGRVKERREASKARPAGKGPEAGRI